MPGQGPRARSAAPAAELQKSGWLGRFADAIGRNDLRPSPPVGGGEPVGSLPYLGVITVGEDEGTSVGNKIIELNSRQCFMAISRMRFKGDNNGTFYIDLAKALSLQERKMHRQKAIYTVYGGFFADSDGNRIDINTAPMTWVTKRAVNRGFAMWRKMTAKTLQDAGATSKSKYRDFKVFLDNQMGASPLVPVDASSNNLYSSAPEWDYSTLVSDDPDGPGGSAPDQFELQIVGPHVGADPNWSRIGLVESWVNSRPTPVTEDPTDIPDTTDPLLNLFDASDSLDNRIDHINAEGDQAPYDETHMFGMAVAAGGSNNLQRQSLARPTANTQLVAPIHGFQALCGLVQLVVGSDTSSNSWELVLDVETKGEMF